MKPPPTASVTYNFLHRRRGGDFAPVTSVPIAVPMDTTWTIPAASTMILVVAVVQFAIGVSVGLVLARRAQSRQPGAAGQDRRVVALLDELRSLAKVIAGDLTKHYRTIGDIEGDLARETDDPSTADYRTVLKMVSKILEANSDLQKRLGEAEGRLEDQSEEIQHYIAEARTDPLTGLLNRRAFDDELARRMAEWKRRGTPVSLLLVDADRFKAVNDQYGHPGGDEALRVLADMLTEVTRDMDLVARIGGEEFAIILPDTPLADAQTVAVRVQQDIRPAVVESKDSRFSITVSSGLAQAAKGEDADGIIARADVALYHAKHGGRDCSFLHDGSGYQRIVESSEADSESELQDICADLKREVASAVQELGSAG